MKKRNRRSFLKRLGKSAGTLAAAPTLLTLTNEGALAHSLRVPKRVAANDKIRIACIGVGSMGIGDMNTALMVDGVECVAACDLYDGHLTRAKELWGKDIMTTRDYREILERDDIDAVINATTDHWHKQISIDAMNKGKAVYCEKPMVHKIEEGHELLKVQQETGAVFQVGSQFVSGIGFVKARELVTSGAIGNINFAESIFDRFSAMGAWQYSIPLDASPKTVDWDTYISNTEKREWDPLRFFRWRNYLDYGTGVSGDLFVHLLSMLHFIVDSKGPNLIYSTGGLRYWKDGREVPDIQIGTFDYPETDTHPAFNYVMRSNFIDGSGGNFLFRIVGDEGEIKVGWSTLEVKKKKMPEAPGMFIHHFAEDQQEAFKAYYAEKYPTTYEMQAPEVMHYTQPKGYKGDRFEHFSNFFEAMRHGKPVVEDAAFGLRACAPTLAGNTSYFEKKLVKWDAENMKIVG